MSGLRQPEMQPIMSPREQTQGQHQGSWPRGLPSLDGTTRKAPQHPGRPDKEALCSPRDRAQPTGAAPAQEQRGLAPIRSSHLHLSLVLLPGGSLLLSLSLSLSVILPLQQHILQTSARHPKRNEERVKRNLI